MTLVWLDVANLLMVLHYKLFKHSKLFSARCHTEGTNIFDFAQDTRRNPAGHALVGLVSMLMDPLGAGRTHLHLLMLKVEQQKKTFAALSLS